MIWRNPMTGSIRSQRRKTRAKGQPWRPLLTAVNNARKDFNKQHTMTDYINEKYTEKIDDAFFLLSATYYSNISAASWGWPVCLVWPMLKMRNVAFYWHQWSNSFGKHETCSYGPWIYQFVPCLSNGLPYQLYKMIIADKSNDEVVRVRKTATHCILMFDNYYFSTGYI